MVLIVLKLLENMNFSLDYSGDPQCNVHPHLPHSGLGGSPGL